MILIGSDFAFKDDDDVIPVKNLPENLDDLTEDSLYLIGKNIYTYAGVYPNSFELHRDYPEGGVFARMEKNPDKIVFQEFSDDATKEACGIDNITSEHEAKFFEEEGNDPEALLIRYFHTFEDGNNMAVRIKQKPMRDGQPYVPSFRRSDDPLERLVKIVVASMKIISSVSRNTLENDYEFDNLVSTFEGSTNHTSILKIMEWCTFLDLDWEFSVFSIEEHKWKLESDLSVSRNSIPSYDIDTSDQKNVFKVKFSEGDDPLKRLTKYFLDVMNCPSSFYRDRGSTPHLVNNMMSALKSSQKMTMKYFINWCNLLGLGFGFKLTRPDGIWYKTIGYAVSTNDPDPYAMNAVKNSVFGEEEDE